MGGSIRALHRVIAKSSRPLSLGVGTSSRIEAQGTPRRGGGKRTRIDEDHRGARNHDLLVRDRVGSRPVVIGVEGKADGSFDDPPWRY